MSLFQLTLILGGILFREQEHRQEHMNLGAGGAAPPGGAESGRRFAGAGELKNAACRRYEQHESS
jgi:hypothetical protein